MGARWGLDPRSIHTSDLKSGACYFPALHRTLWERARELITQCPKVKTLTVAFTMLAQLCDHKAEETAMGTALFSRNSERRTSNFFQLFDIPFC